MKTTVIIPTYWARESTVGWMEGDAVYDHPTALDREGTIGRVIESMKVLNNRDFQLVVIACPTADDIALLVEKKVEKIVHDSASKVGVDAEVFGPSKLAEVHRLLNKAGAGEYTDLLKLKGYSTVRNLCLYTAHLLGSDVAVLIDDDEVFEDPDFMSKAVEFIGKKIDGEYAHGVAGYYLQPSGGYKVEKKLSEWMKQWGQIPSMNEAFESLIPNPPRLKKTPLVFGGNMVIHRQLFTKVPFDPNVRRGEDIDYLINARMYGYTFYLDRELSIKHLAPPKSHPDWMQLREDIYRFTYERSKLRSQRPAPGMTLLQAEDFDPYPGRFLGDELEDRVEAACVLLSEEYRRNRDQAGWSESLKNLEITTDPAFPGFNPFEAVISLQKRWKSLMTLTETDAWRTGIFNQLR
ncbi:MAG TPA: hypothetical protein ENH13_04300 [Euryarchaeota archaeon]|nr:hypothetical protein [Euryarchaeota archaeon]